MDGRRSAPSSSPGAAAAAATVAFPEENGIVLDKWLMDVCGEEDLQFPSHRRALYPAYVDHLRRVSKSRQFIANTFDYPSRSGTREVLVLQKTLEALGAEEQRVRREINQVQENVTQVRRVLDERTMGAASLVEEERVQAAKLAEMRAEQAARAAAVATPSSAAATPSTASPVPRGYAPLSAATPVAVVTAPPRPPAAKADTPLPMPEDGNSEANGSSANSSVSSRSAASTTSGQMTVNTFSAIARAARRADYDKKKALSQRYVVEVQRKAQDAASRRADAETRHAALCAEKRQLDQEYEALQTTEALVVARHEEAEAHEHEETALLAAEAAAYAVEDAAFATVWEEAEEGGEGHEGETAAAAEAHAVQHVDPAAVANADTSPLETSTYADDSGTAVSASRTPAEHDTSPPEALLTANRPPSHGSNSVASSSPAHSHTPSPVERELRLNTHAVEEDEEEENKGEAAAAASVDQPPYGAATAVVAAPATARSKEARRAQLEELRHRLSELGAATQACKRQLLNTAQVHMGRFRQAQQRLKDWQDMSANLRATYHQQRGQVDVLTTALQDAAARLDSDTADTTYTQQLYKLNAVLRERSYETLQYYMGSGDAAATDMMYDASAEEELRALHRPSPSAAAGGMSPLRGAAPSTASSAAPTREGSVSSAYHANANTSSGGVTGSAVDVPHKHRSRYELVRHLQRWEAALLTDRLAILKAASMTPGPFNGAGANTRRAEGFNVTRCYQELRHLLLQPKQSNGTTAA